MSVEAVRAGLGEARSVWGALDSPSGHEEVSRVSVTGMLAEQLARELGRRADTGAVVVGDASRPPDSGIAVHVIAGDPSEIDVAFVDGAERHGVHVVLVELWPQRDWTPPFVLSPFVVECRPGEGFPLAEIGARIVEATGGALGLAPRIPVLRRPATQRAIREAVARTAFLAALGRRGPGTRAALTFEQALLLARLLQTSPSRRLDVGPSRMGAVAALLAAGLALRELARSARAVLPEPVADAAVAAGATWALGKAYRGLEELLGDGAEG